MCPLRYFQLNKSKMNDNLKNSITAQTAVSLALTHSLFKSQPPTTNVIFSPLSLHVILSLIAAGSTGQTLDQLLSFLKSKSTKELNELSSQLVALVFADGSAAGGPRVAFANGVWVEQILSLKKKFSDVVRKVYKATAKSVDFQTKAIEVASAVNLWAEKETNGLIKEILPSGAVDNTTRLIFANALYFKGAWNEKFDASKTKEHKFHLFNGNTVEVPFMTSKKKQAVRAFDGFKVLGLPYKHANDKRYFTMYIFLPDAKDGLFSLMAKVSSEYNFLDRHIPHQKVEVGKFLVPKFKISFGFEASQMLKGLGIVLPFSGGGLTEMVESPVGKDLYVSSIFHKSFIEVNEEGTEAAAASAAVIMYRSAMVEENVDFVADHPFLFLIKEDVMGVVLFIGQVVNPLIS